MVSFFDLSWLWPFLVWFEGRTYNLSYHWMSSTVLMWCNYCKLISCLQICRGVGNRKSTESNTNVSVSSLNGISMMLYFICMCCCISRYDTSLGMQFINFCSITSYMFFSHIHSQKTVCSQMDWVVSGDTLWSIHILTSIICKFKPFWCHDFHVDSEEFCIWIWGIVHFLVLQG